MANCCVPLLEEFFDSYVNLIADNLSSDEALIVILDKGIVRPQCCDVCPICSYVLASTDTSLKLLEATKQPNCCVSYYVNEEKRNILLDAGPSLGVNFQKYDDKQNDVYILNSMCKTNFSGCVEYLKSNIDPASFELIKQKGLIENERIFDQSALCFILNFFINKGITNPVQLGDIFNTIIDKGIVINCIGKNFTVIASVETYLKFAEAVGLTTSNTFAPL